MFTFHDSKLISPGISARLHCAAYLYWREDTFQDAWPNTSKFIVSSVLFRSCSNIARAPRKAFVLGLYIVSRTSAYYFDMPIAH